MQAVLSHNVLVSNYVPFFDLYDSSIEALDSALVVFGQRYLEDHKHGQLLWVVTSPKRMLDLEDETTHVMNLNPTVVLCGFEGTAPKEQFLHVFATLPEFDTWAKGLDLQNLISFTLRHSEDGSKYYYLHHEIESKLYDYEISRSEIEYFEGL